jgi:hypothetical protein
MPSLFYLPKVTSLAGSKLYFYATGTSTPQAVYTDEDLTVPHSNPVVADASGVFAPIYFDGTVGNFRVSHYTSADVLIYTVDDVPSGPGNMVTGIEISQTTNPRIRLKQKGAASNNADWIIQVASEQLKFSLINSALSSEGDYLIIDRNANTCDAVAWTTTSHTINGDESLRGDTASRTSIASRNTTTTLTADDEMVISLRGSAKYVIEGELYFYATTTAGMGLKFDLNYSGSIDSQRSGVASYYVNGTGAVAQGALLFTTAASIATLSTNVTTHDLYRFCSNVQTSTAGTLSLRWAQVSSSANNLNLMDKSWIRATRLP